MRQRLVLYALYGESQLREAISFKEINYFDRRVGVSLQCARTVPFESLQHFEHFYPFFRLINSFGVRSLILNVLFDPAYSAAKICKHSYVLRFIADAWYWIEPFCEPKKLALSTFKNVVSKKMSTAVQYQFFAFNEIAQKKPVQEDSDDEYADYHQHRQGNKQSLSRYGGSSRQHNSARSNSEMPTSFIEPFKAHVK